VLTVDSIVPKASPVIEYDTRSSTIRDNPYPCYRSIRNADPVHWNPILSGWMITRYPDLEKFFLATELTAKRTQGVLSKVPTEVRDQMTAIEQAARRWLLFTDPPEHKRVRSIFNKAFSVKMISRLEDKIIAIIDECLDKVIARGRFDFIDDLANPLPIFVISDMLGVPRADRDQLWEWSKGISALTATPRPSPELCLRANRYVEEIDAYFTHIVEARRRRPGDDLISALIRAIEDDPDFDNAYILANCSHLMIAGHETTTALLGNGLLALLEHPSIMSRVRESPELIDMVIEEMLRYESPVQWMTRQVMTPFSHGGKQLEEGQMVFLMIGAANRDEDVFPDADRFIIDRYAPGGKAAKHLAFGHGFHKCLGAQLARLEARHAFRRLLDRFSGLTRVEKHLDWRSDIAFRGLTRLPLAFEVAD